MVVRFVVEEIIATGGIVKNLHRNHNCNNYTEDDDDDDNMLDSNDDDANEGDSNGCTVVVDVINNRKQ